MALDTEPGMTDKAGGVNDPVLGSIEQEGDTVSIAPDLDASADAFDERQGRRDADRGSGRETEQLPPGDGERGVFLDRLHTAAGAKYVQVQVGGTHLGVRL